VLALCEVFGYEAVLDDQVARGQAESHGIAVTATLNLLCAAIRECQLTLALVEKIADDLIASEYFLPFPPGGFRSWVAEEGLFPQD
jgi:predicted nucleic acid-binding protein